MKRCTLLILFAVAVSGCATMGDILQFSERGRQIDAEITATRRNANTLGNAAAAEIFGEVGKPGGPTDAQVATACINLRVLTLMLGDGVTVPTLSVRTILRAQGFEDASCEIVMARLHQALEVEPLIKSTCGQAGSDMAMAAFLEGFLTSADLCFGDIPKRKEKDNVD